MGYWCFMLSMDLLCPLLMIGFGWLFSHHAPKKINSLYGYRTGMSMKNQDTWDFAHHFFGKLWFKWGLILLPITIIPLLFVLGKDENTVGIVGLIVLGVQMIPLIGAIFPTEKALHKTFDIHGNRR